MRTAFLTLLSFAAASVAIVALINFAGTELDQIGAHLLDVGPGAVVLICTATLVQAAISAFKWRLVLFAFETEPAKMPGARLSLLLASLAAVAAQFLPLIIAASALRSLAARYASGTPVLKGALASAVEQAFDVLSFSLFLLPTLVLFALALAGIDGGFGTWAIVAALTLGAAFSLLGAASAWTARRLIRTLGLNGRWGGVFEAIAGIDARLQRRLLWLSLLRYGAILVRVMIVAGAAGFDLPLVHLVYGHTVVQAAQLAAVTPGNLGIAEWTWVGALGYLGHDIMIIAIFSLTLRVVSVVSYVLVSGLAAAYYAGPLLRAKFARWN